MKIKLLAGIIGASIVTAAVGAGGFAGAHAADLPQHHFKGIASFSSSPVYKARAKPFWANIEKETNGKITADLLTIDQLGFKGDEVFRMLKMGLFDFVTNVMSYGAGDDPRNEALDLAGVAQDIPDLSSMAKSYRPVIDKLYKEKYNLKTLAVWPIGPVVIWCNKPVSSLADLKGLKVRGFNKTMSDFLKSAGATPVSMSFGDMVTALDRGTIDCAVTSPHSGLKAGVAEVTTHILPITLGWATVIEAFNVGTWNRLDKATQEYLSKKYEQHQKQIYKIVADETADAYRCMTGQKPCKDSGPMRKPLTVAKLSDADKAKVKELVKTAVLPSWAKRCGSTCVDQWNGSVGKSIDVTLGK